LPVSAQQRRELADFLRTRRERVQPADVGLPRTSRRRTPGLRREELAMLAGISATWYTYLEQARDVRVSEQVLDGLATALVLDDNERTHLFLLAHGSAPANRTAPREALDPKVTRLLQILEPNPAYVTGARYDLLGWNPAAAALFTGFDELPKGRRNLAWWVFTNPAAKAVLVEWEHEAQALLARFRAAAGRHADDPSFASLADELSSLSPEFTTWWRRHDVLASSSGTKTMRDPQLGVVTLDHTVLKIADATDQHLVIYTRGTVEGT
jgi:transcriptional regulator with XRE-family HTH domain